MIAKILIVIMAVPLLVSCAAVQVPSNYTAPMAGELVSVHSGTVIQGIRAALAGQPGTTILCNGSRYLFVWSAEYGVAFWGIDLNGKAVDILSLLRGSMGSSSTVSGLVSSLTSSGWERVAPSAVPAAIAQIAGTRLASAPVLLLAVGAFPGGFDVWFDETFYPVEVDL